jgi:rare lipoprotein A
MIPARVNIAMLAAALCGASACAAPAAGAQFPAPTPVAPAVPAAGAASLTTAPGALRGQVTRLRGAFPDLPAGATVQIQRQDRATTWVDEARTTTGAGGAFVASWRPKVLGRFVVRALAGGGQVRAATAAAPTAQLTVYRPARTTWYGPGLYGRKTACGQVLSHRLVGVAHRTLPCGTPVEVYLGGRAITVPVVDRGPFGNGAHYDLTSAAAEQLGVTQTTTLGVAPQRGATLQAPLAAPPAFAGTGGAPPVP